MGVTQLPSRHIGNWVTCQATLSPIDPKAVEWDIATVLGNHQDALLEVYARRIVDRMIQQQLIPGSSHVALVLGISLLQKLSPATAGDNNHSNNKLEQFRLLVDALVGLIAEALGVVLYKE